MKEYSIDEFIQHDAGLRSLVEEVRPIVEDVVDNLEGVACARFFGGRDAFGRFLVRLEMSEHDQPEAATAEFTISDLRNQKSFQRVALDLWGKVLRASTRRAIRQVQASMQALSEDA